MGRLADQWTLDDEADEGEIVAGLSIRNLVVDGHRTSVRLEPLLWDALQDIARRRKMTIHELATEIATQRTLRNLTAAIRVYIVGFYRTAADRTSAAISSSVPS